MLKKLGPVPPRRGVIGFPDIDLDPSIGSRESISVAAGRGGWVAIRFSANLELDLR